MNKERAAAPALTDDEKRAMRGRHPLYTRLSGDVVWGLFEETGCTAEQCGGLMDAFIEEMHNIIDSMAVLERAEVSAFVLDVPESACENCRALHGIRVPLAYANWRDLLPPFAVGCLARLRLEKDCPASAFFTAPKRPDCALLCPCCTLATGA